MASHMSPGYRSATEYSFGEGQTDGIVKTAAYHREDYFSSAIWFSHFEHFKIRGSIALPPRRPSFEGLGSLDRLPLELLNYTMLNMDMRSLFKFRQTNLRARQMVDSLKQYQVVVSFGLNFFLALLRTRLANNISLLDFYNALCTKDCALCGEFGGFIFLLTWQRCCFNCLKVAPETQVQTLNAVRKHFHFTKVEVAQLRSFKSLPGMYLIKDSLYKTRIAIVSLHQASLIRRQQPHTPVEPLPSNTERNQKFNFMGSCALPYYNKRTNGVEFGVSCAGCELALEKDIIGTKGEDWAYEARDKVYARDAYLEHFRWCEQAQLLWRSSDGGKKTPTELPEGARCGGYFQKVRRIRG